MKSANPCREANAGRWSTYCLLCRHTVVRPQGSARHTNLDSLGNLYDKAAVTYFGGNKALAEAYAALGYLDVSVLNNFRKESARDAWVQNGTFQRDYRAQDFLYYHAVPDGGTTAMPLGGALVTLGALRRKRAQ